MANRPQVATSCPVCEGELDADMVGMQPTSRCESCGGTWVSQGRVDAIAGQEVELAIARGATAEATQCRRCRGALKPDEQTCSWCERQAVISCPAGHGPMATAIVTIGTSPVELDHCATCGGIWFDAQERGHVEGLGQAAVKVQQMFTAPGASPRRRVAQVDEDEDEHSRAWWLSYALVAFVVLGLIGAHYLKRQEQKEALRVLWADRCIASVDNCEQIIMRGSDICYEHTVRWFYHFTEGGQEVGPWTDQKYMRCMMSQAPKHAGINWVDRDAIDEILYP